MTQKALQAESIRWGVIPCARVVEQRWLPGMKKLGISPIAIASRSADKADAWARQYEIARVYGNYQGLLDDQEVDAVLLALPNSMHFEWIMKALQVGKHVLCDKPLTMNAGQAQEATALAEAENLLLVEGFMYQYHTQFEQIGRWLDEGRIGRLKTVRVSFSFVYDNPGNFRNEPELGGGVLLDLGCYCVHLIRRFFNESPERVYAVQHRSQTGADWTTTAVLEYEGERMAMMDCSFGYQGNQYLHLVGTLGNTQVPHPFNPKNATCLTLTDTRETNTVEFQQESLYARCLADFGERWASGTYIPSPGRDSVANLVIMDAIRESASMGR